MSALSNSGKYFASLVFIDKDFLTFFFLFADGEENVHLERIRQLPSLDVLPDGCMVDILRRLSRNRDRSNSACVSHRWLSLIVSIQKNSILKSGIEEEDDGDEEEENRGYQERRLAGNHVTDVRLASIAVGTTGGGGLGKLTITGNHPTRGATDFGLSAVAHCCPSLRLLSISNVPSVSDLGLSEIASCCPLLETLRLDTCPSVTDKGLIVIAENCPNLTSLTVDSCTGIANYGIRKIAERCRKLHSVSIKNCPLVTDYGIAGLIWLASSTLAMLKLVCLNITDLSLACIGIYGNALTELYLTGLFNVAERGFLVMGRGLGLQKLRSIFVTACPGVTDIGLGAVANGCPTLKRLCLRLCYYLSDVGLLAFAEAVPELEHLGLQECHRVSLLGVIGLVMTCKENLRTLCLIKCLGIVEIAGGYRQFLPTCTRLLSLVIRDCSNLSCSGLIAIGRICSNLVYLDLSGPLWVTDVGLLPLVESSQAGMVRVTLKGCVNLTDSVVSSMVELHGGTLRELRLVDCNRLTNKSLLAISDNCTELVELYMSGVNMEVQGKPLNLRSLSLGGCSELTEVSSSSGSALSSALQLHLCEGIRGTRG